MARNAEQILREIVAENVFKIAQLASENEKLTEELDKYRSWEDEFGCSITEDRLKLEDEKK